MPLSLKPTHVTVKAYYEALHQFGQLYIDHEGAVRSPFQILLAKCGQKASPKLTLVPEYRIERARTSVIVDGALVDLYRLPHGYWEAKDESDDLIREVEVCRAVSHCKVGRIPGASGDSKIDWKYV